MPRKDRPIEGQEKVVVWNWGLKDLDTPNLAKRDSLGRDVRGAACRCWRCVNVDGAPRFVSICR